MPKVTKSFVLLCAALALGSACIASASAMVSGKSNITCRLYSDTRSAKSILFHTTTVAIELDTSVCFNGTEFAQAEEDCKVAYSDPLTVTVDPCITSHYYYGWAPAGQQDPKGGYHSQATFVVRNCVFHWGCWSSANVTLELFITADGQYVKLDGR
jgi:hypothetical protein